MVETIKKMELSRRDTKMLQGLSVLAMVCLHLFNRWDYTSLYYPLIYIKGIPLCFYLAQMSDFCVMGFAFCSGYGHMALRIGNEGSSTREFAIKRYKSLFALLCNYWFVLIVFSIISILAGQGSWMPGSIHQFVGTALLYDISYNGAWWYMYAYVFLVLISPVLLKATERLHPILVLGIGFGIYVLAYYFRFWNVTDNYILQRFGPTGMTIYEYMLGSVCCKTRFFTNLYKYWERLNSYLKIFLAGMVLVGILLGHTLVVASLFVAPTTGMAIMTLFHFWKKPPYVEKFFLFIGRHSTNIWLTHMFFYLVLFKNLVYKARYPILIYLFMLLLTIAVSMILQWLERPLMKQLK